MTTYKTVAESNNFIVLDKKRTKYTTTINKNTDILRFDIRYIHDVNEVQDYLIFAKKHNMTEIYNSIFYSSGIHFNLELDLRSDNIKVIMYSYFDQKWL